jgi:4'-phosphopantetheinyl transferase
VFTRAERARMDALPVSAQRDHFFRMWTCKEALVKCTGLGIHSGMAEFQVSLDPDGSARVTGAWERQAGVGRLLVHRLPLGAGHAGALVHEPPPSALSLHLLIGKTDPLAAL